MSDRPAYPLGEKEFMRLYGVAPIVDERQPAAAPGTNRFHPSDNDRDQADPGGGGDEQSHTPEPFELEIVTARELCARPDPDLSDTYLLGPLLRRGERTIFGGATVTGDGKTTFAARALSAAVRGTDFLGWKGAGGLRALILDLEQSERDLKRVLREAGLDEGADVDIVRVPDGLALNCDRRHVAEVERVLEEGRYDLVFLDPWYKAHRGDSNSEQQIVVLTRLLDGWRERLRFGLPMSTHSRKKQLGSNGFTIDDLFGSSGFVRGAEVIVGIELVEQGVSRLHFLKDRAGELPARGTKWVLLFDRETGYRLAPEPGGRDVAAEIADYLREHPGASKSEITKGIGARAETVSAVLGADERFTTAPPTLYGKPSNATCWILAANADNLFPDLGKGSEGVASEGRSIPLPDDPSPPVRGRSAGKGLETPLPDDGKALDL
jgi:hypothetical protein